MATLSRSIRRGLPRVEGGEPWPPAGQAPARIATAEAAETAEAADLSASVSGVESAAAAAPSAPAAVQETAPRCGAVSAGPGGELRRRGGAAASPRPAARAGRRTLAAGGRGSGRGGGSVRGSGLRRRDGICRRCSRRYCRGWCCRGSSGAGNGGACSGSGRHARHTDDGNHLAASRASPCPPAASRGRRLGLLRRPLPPLRCRQVPNILPTPSWSPRRRVHRGHHRPGAECTRGRSPPPSAPGARGTVAQPAAPAPEAQPAAAASATPPHPRHGPPPSKSP